MALSGRRYLSCCVWSSRRRRRCSLSSAPRFGCIGRRAGVGVLPSSRGATAVVVSSLCAVAAGQAHGTSLRRRLFHHSAKLLSALIFQPRTAWSIVVCNLRAPVRCSTRSSFGEKGASKGAVLLLCPKGQPSVRAFASSTSLQTISRGRPNPSASPPCTEGPTPTDALPGPCP